MRRSAKPCDGRHLEHGINASAIFESESASKRAARLGQKLGPGPNNTGPIPIIARSPSFAAPVTGRITSSLGLHAHFSRRFLSDQIVRAFRLWSVLSGQLDERVSVRSKKERVISAGYDSVGFLRFDGDHDGLDRNHSPAL